MRRLTTFILGLLLAVASTSSSAQDCGDLFDEHQVLDLFVTMDPADWDALRTSCPAGICGPRPHFYWSAQLRCEDGPEITVGIRRKNGSAEPSESDPQKPAIKIDINEFVPGQTFLGKVKFNLENGAGSSGGGGGGGADNGVREGLSWLLYEDAGVVASHVAWVKLWVNGNYKGLYTHVEQVDKEFLIDHGIDEGGWLFKGPSGEQRTREGEPNPFAFNWYPFDHKNPEDPQPADWRDQTLWRVDMTQLLTLAAAVNFVGNKDAVVFKNNNYWYYDWQLFPEGQQPRLYLGWDNDTVMKGGDSDMPILGTFFNNGHMAQGLIRDDPGFQAQYYQIYDDLLNGPLSLASTLARVNAVETAIGPALDADPHQTGGSAAAQFQSVRDFLTARTAFLLAELGACPNAVCESAESACSCPADCGSPPSAESVCNDGIDEDCDNAVDCSDSDCTADPSCQTNPLANEIIVNEVLANTSGSPDVEYVEILNNGPGAQDLTGWYLLDDDNGHDKCFLDGTLQPGDYLVVAGLIDEFSTRYPDAVGDLNPNPFDSETSGVGYSLGDGGDHVRLFRPTSQGDEFVDGLTLGPQGEDIAFGYVPEGTGAPEYVTSPTPALSNDLSSYYSPVCINEFLTTSQVGGVDDWIELYNRSASAVDIGGWHLSDGASQPTKYTFTPGTTIPAGGFLSVDETELGFALSSTGSEVVVLTHSDGETGQDYFDFDTQFPDVTQGRFPDGAPNWVFLERPSRDFANRCGVDNLDFTSTVDLVWDPVAGATGYDVVSGELALLVTTSGDFSAAVTACEEDDSPDTATQDVDEPAVGNVFFYLVRAVGSSCGIDGYDSGSPSQPSSRDEGVDAALAGCP